MRTDRLRWTWSGEGKQHKANGKGKGKKSQKGYGKNVGQARTRLGRLFAEARKKGLRNVRRTRKLLRGNPWLLQALRQVRPQGSTHLTEAGSGSGRHGGVRA